MLTHQPIHTPPCIPTIMQTSSVGVLNAADGHADVFLSRVANDLWQVPPHRSEPNLHGRQRRGCPEKGIGACALEVAGVHSLASRKRVEPIGRRSIAIVEPLEPALSVFPAVNAPPIPSVNVVHSPSEGTCHPEGQKAARVVDRMPIVQPAVRRQRKGLVAASPPGAGP